jgi:hypothetical protein
MEQAMNRIRKAADASDAVPYAPETVRADIRALEAYYGSDAWMKDYEADEQGKLPDDLKRGVLSEDAVYDLITEHDALMVRLQKIVLRSMEENN